MFPESKLLAGPKHSTSVSFSAGVAMPLRVDEKEGPFVSNPVSDLALKASPGPQGEEKVDLWKRLQSLLPFTLQMVNPFIFPTTVQLNVKASPGQAGRASVNCPATLPGRKYSHPHMIMRTKVKKNTEVFFYE